MHMGTAACLKSQKFVPWSMTTALHDVFELPWVMTLESEVLVEQTRQRIEQRLASLQAQHLLPTLLAIFSLTPAIVAAELSLEKDEQGREFYMVLHIEDEDEQHRVASWEAGDHLGVESGATIDEFLQDLNNILSGSPSNALLGLLREEVVGKRLTLDGLEGVHRQLAGPTHYDAWKAHSLQQQLTEELPSSSCPTTRPRF